MIAAVSESVARSRYVSGNAPGAVKFFWGNAAFSCSALAEQFPRPNKRS